MTEKMKVHAFSVNVLENKGSIRDLLEQIEQDKLSDRVRNVGYSELRIEHIENKNGLWFIDFGKFRDQHGPGKASRATPIEGFKFDEGQVFCEETACLYIESSNHLIIQYNHHGARAGTVQEYLNSYNNDASCSFELRPKYDESVDRKFRDRAATKKLIFEIDPRFLSEGDRQAGTALTQALDIGNQSNGEKVELVISAGRPKNQFLSDFIDRTAEFLKLKAEENPDAVTKLKVGVLEHLDSRMDVLDLIAQRLVREFTDIPIGADLRFPRKKRYSALESAYKGWRTLL